MNGKMINLEKEIREQPSVLAGVKAANIDTIKAIAAEYRARGLNNIVFAARGTSDHASIYAQYLLGIYAGIPAMLATPSVVTVYGSKLKYTGSLVIGVSQSGKAADVLEIIKLANGDGNLTVALTNNTDSPLAKEAKYHLFCNAGSETSIAATKTFTSQCYALALLVAELSGSKELAEGLEKVPAAVAELLEYMPTKIEGFAPRCRHLKAGVVLGRGTAYPIALEGALKVLETNRIKMRGYANSDFYHGSLAQLFENDLAIVLAAEGPMLSDAIAMINRLNGINAEVLVISDSDEALSKSKFALPLPKLGSDALSPFLMAVTMQLLALKLTEVNGIDPDASKLLNKVTITK
mgnify:CR=1 FL=1